MDKLKVISWKTWVFLAACLAFIFVCAGQVAVGSLGYEPATPIPAATRARTSWPTAPPVEFAYLSCAECKAAGMFINLWASPDRIGINGRCQHGQMVHIVTHQQHTDGLHYYKVECGSVVGWVSQYMISYAPPAD